MLRRQGGRVGAHAALFGEDAGSTIPAGPRRSPDEPRGVAQFSSIAKEADGRLGGPATDGIQ